MCSGEILVIELNPFLVTTDACCFDWKYDADILNNNTKLNTTTTSSSSTTTMTSDNVNIDMIRVRHSPLKGATSMLYDEMRVSLNKFTSDLSKHR